MASRTKQKEEARARRLAEERARAERERRQRRIRSLGGIVLIAVAIVVVAIVISTRSGPKAAPKIGSAASKQAAATVNASLAGIPQSGNRLGSPAAKVTVTEYGDLQCPICRDFASGTAAQLISKDVRQGKAQLVYRSLETASQSSPTPNAFPIQQAAALAAGQQGKAWNFILLFYKLQGQEGTGYMNTGFLNGIAAEIPGLNFSQWSSARTSSSLTSQVSADEQSALSQGFKSTPTVVVKGPKGQAQAIVGAAPYSQVESAIKSVS